MHVGVGGVLNGERGFVCVGGLSVVVVDDEQAASWTHSYQRSDLAEGGNRDQSLRLEHRFGRREYV